VCGRGNIKKEKWGRRLCVWWEKRVDVCLIWKMWRAKWKIAYKVK
jgi:hypothetical protein